MALGRLCGCAGLCDESKSKDVAAISAWAVDSLDISLPNFDCRFDGGKGISHLPDILLFFAKPFKDRIIQQLRGPIVNEINGLLKSALVDGIIPTQCNPK